MRREEVTVPFFLKVCSSNRQFLTVAYGIINSIEILSRLLEALKKQKKEIVMAKLIYVPLGCSLRSQLAEELSQQPLGEGVLVLPNRLLTDDVRSKYANVETMGMDTLASKLMNLNGGTDYKELSRRSQELIVQDIICLLYTSDAADD